ncbi:MAG TPA: ATP-binding cassette domain-containing protein [Povalibacter sp.]|uniref:ABC transporter ATP-binding protein n=1 Tax=Povalibacter sp. TaxID=1962978 RepID=UPI002BC84709|nr:oligopeptide/dipeptide ABC transporter ATP-binding protein [Povalibacter sp.]HMN47372.1 ATP-binding cassette domain-containing protein [Povalibacter sp.]
MSLVAVEHLTKHFAVRGPLLSRSRAAVRAVDDVSFEIERGATFALVGESGCGKTTLTRLMLGLETPTSGSIRFDGRDLATMNRRDWKGYRRQAQAVFQDPHSSLNPRLRIATILGEPIRAHGLLSGAALERRIAELLDIVGLPAGAARLYPHEFSGGQRQRIAIARALALQPAFMVLDEPVSALDVSIRAQILNLLADIQERFGLTYLVIAHDLALVEHFSDHVAVMYLGNLVETGPTAEVFARPRHPYTQALLAAVPRPDPAHRVAARLIQGEIASALAPPSGCKFHPRCPQVMPVCQTQTPLLRATGAQQRVACHLPQSET